MYKMANHIASISSSSRALRLHEANTVNHVDATSFDHSRTHHEDIIIEEPSIENLSRLSLHNNDNSEFITSSTSATTYDRVQPKRTHSNVEKRLLSTKLEKLDCIEDLDYHITNKNLYHLESISRIELKWQEIALNLQSTIVHLEKCSQKVTESSSDCLETLSCSVEKTCDSIDGELKSFYHTMTKCDELNTKLSIANSFRDEIKTLRKSIETLEQLHKNRSQNAQHCS